MYMIILSLLPAYRIHVARAGPGGAGGELHAEPVERRDGVGGDRHGERVPRARLQTGDGLPVARPGPVAGRSLLDERLDGGDLAAGRDPDVIGDGLAGRRGGRRNVDVLLVRARAVERDRQRVGSGKSLRSRARYAGDHTAGRGP